MFVIFTEVRGMLPPTEDVPVWVNPFGVNIARAHSADLTELMMDNGERVLVRGELPEVVADLGKALG